VGAPLAEEDPTGAERVWKTSDSSEILDGRLVDDRGTPGVHHDALAGDHGATLVVR
jgi:hypothetical protein